MRDFERLAAWQKAHSLVLGVYRATEEFPKSERWGLVDQLRRAAVSIPSNVAEGYGRSTDPEFGRFLSIALGSSSEVKYQLLLARDLHYLPETDYNTLSANLDVIQRMLSTLRTRVVGR